MIWSIAWKNIWRNKVRSLVVIVAVALGLFGGVFSVSIMVGLIEQRMSAAIRNEVSSVQLHHPEFPKNKESKYMIDNANALVAELENMPGVDKACKRLKIMGMASTSHGATGIMINGVEPDKEMQVTELYKTIVNGEYLQKDKRLPILISEKMAKKLKFVKYVLADTTLEKLGNNGIPPEVMAKLETVKNKEFRKESEFNAKLEALLGEKDFEEYIYYLEKYAMQTRLRKKTVLTFQSAEGTLTGGAFRVCGVYKTSNAVFDEMNVFVKSSDLAKLTGLPQNEAHEIALIFKNIKESDVLFQIIKAKYPNLDVQDWKQLAPELGLMTSFMEIIYYILIVIILMALGFAIVNTMLMVVLERVKELGMLMAIGMNRRRVFAMIMLETILLSLVGAVIGLVVSIIPIQYFGSAGIDLSKFYGEGFEAIGFAAELFPEITPEFYAGVTVLVIITGILASIYPARKALKLNPAEAVRTEM